MPVRSLTSSVLRWPDRQAVDASVRAWATGVAESHPEVVRIGYFGSYARGDAGVGSDVDLVVVVSDSDRAFEERALDFDATRLAVPTDLLVYTAAEWDTLRKRPGFLRMIDHEAVWVHPRSAAASTSSPSRFSG